MNNYEENYEQYTYIFYTLKYRKRERIYENKIMNILILKILFRTIKKIGQTKLSVLFFIISFFFRIQEYPQMSSPQVFLH